MFETKACGMRDALRRLSEGFRDRLKRFDSTHNTGKYVRVYMCYLFVLTLFSPSFSLLFFHIYKRRQKRPLVYVLRIIISSHSLSYSLSFFIFFSISLVENILQSHWFTHICETPKKKKKKNANMSNAYQRL